MPWTPAQVRLAQMVKDGKSDKFSMDVASRILSETQGNAKMVRRDVDDDGYAKEAKGTSGTKASSGGMAGRLKRYRRL